MERYNYRVFQFVCIGTANDKLCIYADSSRPQKVVYSRAVPYTLDKTFVFMAPRRVAYSAILSNLNMCGIITDDKLCEFVDSNVVSEIPVEKYDIIIDIVVRTISGLCITLTENGLLPSYIEYSLSELPVEKTRLDKPSVLILNHKYTQIKKFVS